MTGKSVKVDIQFADIRREMHNALRAVDHHNYAVAVCHFNGTGQIRTTAGNVRHLSEGQNSAARGDEFG
ncbi:hypothetical protein D3C81_2047770 [compost metagenome]